MTSHSDHGNGSDMTPDGPAERLLDDVMWDGSPPIPPEFPRREFSLAEIMFGATRSADHFAKNSPNWMECPLCIGPYQNAQMCSSALHLRGMKGPWLRGNRPKMALVAILQLECEHDHEFELHFYEGKGVFYVNVENVMIKKPDALILHDIREEVRDDLPF